MSIYALFLLSFTFISAISYPQAISSKKRISFDN